MELKFQARRYSESKDHRLYPFIKCDKFLIETELKAVNRKRYKIKAYAFNIYENIHTRRKTDYGLIHFTYSLKFKPTDIFRQPNYLFYLFSLYIS